MASAAGSGRAGTPAPRRGAIDASGGPAAPLGAGLTYVNDSAPGITRLIRRGRFVYLRADGQPLRDEGELQRIRKLAVPPAYTDVWICPQPNGHLQATGRDARGRKQYRYHAEWRRSRDDEKFARMFEFGAALPRLRTRVARDLARPVATRPHRDSVIAALVRLLDTTLVRVGNDEYARTNKSYGLTTLRNRHAAVEGSVLRLRFKGKSGVQHDLSVDDPRIARIVRRCQALPGQDLFEYQSDDGQLRSVGSADVNDYLREATGARFTAKDFRTWHATSHALELVTALIGEGALAKAQVNRVLAAVAERLGNTVAVCRKSYVHPGVLDLALRGEGAALDGSAAVKPFRGRGLTAAEHMLMAFLSKQLPQQRPRRARGRGDAS